MSNKHRFFKEMSEYQADGDKSISPEDELLIPGSGLYVGPYSKNSKKLVSSLAVVIEPDDVNFTYIKEDTQYFTPTRRDLPQFFIDNRVQVKMTPKMGKGCFAVSDIEKNTTIESSPVILMHRDTFSNLNEFNGGIHKLSEYPFGWGRDGLVAIALGYGGIYNHKVDPNVTWRPDYEKESMIYTTTRDILSGEELFIRYVPLAKLDALWFYDEESEDWAKRYRSEVKEDLGTIKSWSIFHS